MRKILTSAVEVVGGVCVVVGIAQISGSAGVIAGGVALILLGGLLA